ncbi:unnamed protein product [Urochloa humidicola]
MATRRRMFPWDEERHGDPREWSCRMVREEDQTRRFSRVPLTVNSPIDGVVDMLEKSPSKVSRAGFSNEEQTIREDAVEKVCTLSAGSTSLQLNGLPELFEGDGSNSAGSLPVCDKSVLYSPVNKSKWKTGQQQGQMKNSELFEGDGSNSAGSLPVCDKSVLYSPVNKSKWKTGQQQGQARHIVHIDACACLNFSSLNIIQMKFFFSSLPLYYLEFTSEPTILCSETLWGMLKMLVQLLEERKWEPLQLLIVILPDSRDFHVKLRRIFMEFPCPCALFMPQYVRTANYAYVEDAALVLMRKFFEPHRPPIERIKMILWGTAFMNLFEAKMVEFLQDEKKVKCGLDEVLGEVGEDDDSVLFGPEDIRDSDSDSFYLEELQSSIDQMEYLSFVDSELEDDSFGQMEGDIFGQMEDDYFDKVSEDFNEEDDSFGQMEGDIFGQMEDDYFDKVSEDFNEEDDGQQADGGISSSEAGKPIEDEDDILGDEDVVQVENGIVRHWACANFSYLSQEQSCRFLARIVDMCVAIGMEFNPSPINQAQAGPTDNIERTLLNLTKCGMKEKEEQLGILLMILPDDEHFSDKVKEVCASLGVTFYYCYASEARSPSKGALKTIAYEIQSKVVMRDARLRRLALPLVSEAPMLIFGADIFRCTPGDDNSDFIASVVTSLDWPKFRRYHIGLSHDEGTTNVSARLGSLVGEFINSFSKRGKGNVEKIIFFRNGLKDGQFGDICRQEMSAIEKACARYGYHLPNITYVVVLPHASMGMAEQNGTGAVRGYTFCCRHSGGKKFCSVACYHVVHDDNDFLPGKLQSLTSKLCGIRDRRECPEIDIVPPAYYAKRAGMASREEWGRTKQLMKFRGTESYLVM